MKASQSFVKRVDKYAKAVAVHYLSKKHKEGKIT